jgi:flavin-dependent dehydrogenase
MIPATLTLDEAARRGWDVLVVGAGPAGSLAALTAARAGASVLLVEREALPRRKVCGCCLNGSALAGLAAVGLGGLPAACGAVPLRSLRLGAGGRSATVALPGGVALSREALDAALAAAAVAAGAAFLPQTRAALGGVVSGTRVVELHQGGATATVRADVVLAADGLGGKLLARAGVTDAPADAGARIGAGVVVEGGPDFYGPGVVYMACGAGGYLGLVRLEDGRLDLAAALDAAALHDGGPGGAATRLLAEVGWPSPAPPALTRRARRLAAERVLALGDAAGYVEPFTGEGMAWAVASALAAGPLAAGGWRDDLPRAWAARYRRAVAARQGFCRAAAFVLRRPWLTRAVVGLLRWAPWLARPLAAR